jgi:glycosyltransferase involved in cell wall biosynthesis
MKILVSSFTYPPQTSGVSEIARAQACGLAARGHELVVACDFDPKRTPEHAGENVALRQFNVTGCFDPKSSYSGDIAAYQEFIASTPFDIILCNCWQNWATDLAVPVFGRTRARKVIVTQGLNAQIWQPQRRFPWGLRRWFWGWPYVWRLPRVMDRFDQIVFLSQRQDFGRFFDHWLARKTGRRHVSIIPNGIHLAALREARKDFRERYGVRTKHMILTVANYCERKNQIATLKAFLQARRADATLVFIGSEFNDYSEKVRSLLSQARNRAGEVLLLQHVPKADVNSAYHAADLFLLTAREETQPLAILDAMACAVPFVSTDTGCVSEFPGGLVLNHRAATAAAINRLLDQPEERHRLGEEGRAAAESKYDWNQVVLQCEQLFQRLLNGG